MFKSKILLVLFLLCFTGLCFSKTTQAPVFSKKETLYSTKNGSAIGNLLLNIEPKGDNEWTLTIGDRGGNFFESRTERTLWIFNQRTDAATFRRDMRNRDYPVEVRDLNEFMPFCENGIRFELKDWEELSRQTQISFFINASAGQIVTLRLVFYASSQDNRRRTTIDDEARVRIDFEIPNPAVVAQQQRAAQEAELISLTEKIDYEAVAAQRAAQREDSLLQAETANRGERMVLLNAFIAERNREISALQDDVNARLADKKTKVSDATLDSLVTIANEMKNRVDYWENGYSDILLTNEEVHNRFSGFRIAHTLTLKKIDELKLQQNPLSSVWVFIQNNILLSIGGGVVGLFILKMLQKFIKKMISKGKGAIKQKISKAKNDAKKKAKEQPKKWMQKKKKEKVIDEEFENTDINDLFEI